MFNSTALLIDAFVQQVAEAYHRTWGDLHPEYSSILVWAGRMSLEQIAMSDALYHNVDHTIMVTLVGQEILRGKHLREGGMTPLDWMHFMISLMCHDIGYVRGVCQGDQDGLYSTGVGGGQVSLPRGATDAALTPYHIDRGKRFVRERFAGHRLIDGDLIASNIERTRFPVPANEDHNGTRDFAGLVRAADLIGQMADPQYLRKFPALYHEFAETGVNERLGYACHADLRAGYPGFYWRAVSPYIQDALRYLSVTQEGKQWIANLYAHVFAVEHGMLP